MTCGRRRLTPHHGEEILQYSKSFGDIDDRKSHNVYLCVQVKRLVVH